LSGQAITFVAQNIEVVSTNNEMIFFMIV